MLKIDIEKTENISTDSKAGANFKIPSQIPSIIFFHFK